jgi:hypothetical protein
MVVQVEVLPDGCGLYKRYPLLDRPPGGQQLLSIGPPAVNAALKLQLREDVRGQVESVLHSQQRGTLTIYFYKLK